MAKLEAKRNLKLLSNMKTLDLLRQKLHRHASAEQAAASRRFFKTAPGEYGEGDQFLGITVPQVRSHLPETDNLMEEGVITLLHSPWHEERLLALLIMVRRFEKTRHDDPARGHLVNLYLSNLTWVNNWDLVDSSSPHLLGTWLLTHDLPILDMLANSDSLWENRVAILATQAFIRKGRFDDTLRLCLRFIRHPHDLMHKACGWMLREVGKRDDARLKQFLDQHSNQMPRTMLRYSLEKLPEAVRRHYLRK